MGLRKILFGKKNVEGKVTEKEKIKVVDKSIIEHFDKIPQTEVIHSYKIENILSGFRDKNLKFAVKGNIGSQSLDYKNISLDNVWTLYRENFYESQEYCEGFYFTEKQENSVKHYLKVLQGAKIGELKLKYSCDSRKPYIDLFYKELLGEKKHKRVFLNLEDFSYNLQQKLCSGCSFSDLELKSEPSKELIISCETLDSDKEESSTIQLA
jgi:hypothetical protein